MTYSLEYFKILLKDLWIALRPFSLTLALASTTTGIIVAYKEGFAITPLLAFLVTFAGVLAQSGANLINDYFEGSFRYHRKSPQNILFLGAMRSKFDIFVFLWGLSCFALSALIGLYLVWISSLHLLFVGIIGIIGAYAYTGEPFVYKRRGLGVPLSFLIMGPLMVYGAYVVFSKSFHLDVIFFSLPISFLIPALMFSNEMRDFTRDKNLSLGTLSVRIGSLWSKRLYLMLLIGAFITPLVLFRFFQAAPYILGVWLTLPLAVNAYISVSTFKSLGIPKTNRLHLYFSVLYLLGLLM